MEEELVSQVKVEMLGLYNKQFFVVTMGMLSMVLMVKTLSEETELLS